MTAVAIFPETTGIPTTYRAISGQRQAVGKTAGEALDALVSQLDSSETGTVVVMQHRRADTFFSADQQQRLQELMDRWRIARDAGIGLPAGEQVELGALVEAELRAATARAALLARELGV